MTITLAAVYTPVAIQGGLTGALFREFAFTLAGAVIVSGVVALTLSPMMGSQAAARRRHRARLRRASSTAASTPCAPRYAPRCSQATLRYRPVVLTLWAIVVAADRALLHVLAEGAGARRGPGRRLRHRPGLGQLDARPDEALHDARSTTSTGRSRRRTASSRSPSPPAASAAWSPSRGASATKTTEQLLMEVGGEAGRRSRACASSP